jgi:hypothetical protein
MVGRLVSVILGALAAVAFVRAGPPEVALSVVAIAALAGVGATHRSRWYVTSLFTTFLVLTMLLYSNPTVDEEQWRFAERVGRPASVSASLSSSGCCCRGCCSASAVVILRGRIAPRPR